ncbi:MAG: hypothetical protein INR70_17840 [Parafilimonas terrae]|nr:hypothetical protein [Parafilimonas terrae]
MRAALRLLVGEPLRLAVTAVGLAACATVALFGPHDFATGLGVASTLACLTVLLAIVGFIVGEATGVLPRKDPTP